MRANLKIQAQGIEDLISIGTIGLIKAVNTFCPTRNIKLATYASRCIENEILMHLRKTNSQRSEVSIDEPLNIDWDGNELLLSDVLGSEPDTVNIGIEVEDERNLLLETVGRLEERESLLCACALESAARRSIPRKKSPTFGDFAKLHFSVGKTDH